MNDTSRIIRRQDYRPPDWLVDDIDLVFELDADTTRVRAELAVRRNPEGDPESPLSLDRDGPEVEAVAVDGRQLSESEYTVETSRLVIPDLPEKCQVHTTCLVRPSANTQLEGLYEASGILITQCEAEAFRRITPFPDRPDVMARYRVRLEADRRKFPKLLANGNRKDHGELGNGRHYAVFDDPFPKPSYLFALVAGDLDAIEDSHTTPDGRRVRLYIHASAAHLDRLGHAMDSLKAAMRFDEEVYGLACDLDDYHVVATHDFNMGAMENKGLNVFNAKYLLASPDAATDQDYQTVESVLAHEYFHNWTGNRVTCRDWFQLSLKEGLTVFREQQFSEARQSVIRRIEDANLLRTLQFPEDAGPMAHPVRPDEYEEINNFYTLTVYGKGAAVVRMYHTLLGEDGFRRGMDLYFERHDGKAVTCDDFLAAMADANGRDLSQFALWYSQAGTPEVTTETEWDDDRGELTLTLRQHCPAIPGQPDPRPMLIPFAVGLLDDAGRDLPVRIAGEASVGAGTRVLELRDEEQRFVFDGLESRPVVSLLRGFSAPVKLRTTRPASELAFLMANDNDAFARWDAAQALQTEALLGVAADLKADRTPELPAEFIQATAQALADEDSDPALVAELVRLPSENYLAEQMKVIDVDGIHAAREFARRRLGQGLAEQWLSRHQALGDSGPYRPERAAMARRRLRNVCLGYIAAAGDESADGVARKQYRDADNLTDRLAALTVSVHDDLQGSKQALEDFYRRWGGDPLLSDKWLGVQATVPAHGTLDRVEELTGHECFDWSNPNKVFSLVRSFSEGNPVGFHRPDGAGYRFLADAVIRLDESNSQVAATLVRGLERWRRLDEERSALMRAELERVAGTEGLSRATGEIVRRSLEGA
jgi:aminopeptidase N